MPQHVARGPGPVADDERRKRDRPMVAAARGAVHPKPRRGAEQLAKSRHGRLRSWSHTADLADSGARLASVARAPLNGPHVAPTV